MKARDVVGRKITRVRQQMRRDTNGGFPTAEVLGIDLEGGRHLYFSVAEQADGGEYIVRAHVASGANLDTSDEEPTERKKTTVDKLIEACRAIEADAKETAPSERVKITGSTMGIVQAALNLVDDEDGTD